MILLLIFETNLSEHNDELITTEPDQLKDVNTGSLRTDQKGGKAVEEWQIASFG